MLSQQLNKQLKQKQVSLKTSFLIKIHIGPNQETQILLSRNSNIDQIIEKCIKKYKLKKQAHVFLKKQIQASMKVPSLDQRFKTDFSKGEKQKKFIQLVQCVANPLIKKQTIMKDLKSGDIDKNRINIQRTPKNYENGLKKKQSLTKKKKNSSLTNLNFMNSKASSVKQKQSFRQNLQILPVLFKNNSHENGQKRKLLLQSDKLNKKCQKTKQTEKSFIKSIKDKTQSESSFLHMLESQQSLIEGMKGRRIKTQNNNIENQRQKMLSQVEIENSKQTDMKQFSLIDLQNQMNEQMIDLKYQKRIRRLQPELCNLFHSIIRYNPPKINRIDPRYACFQDLSEKVIKSLHQFLVQLRDHQLNSLDFEHFKSLIIKYRSDLLLDSLK